MLQETEAPFVLSGGEAGGRSVLGVSGVRPSAVEQSASEAAGLQLGERTCTRKIFFFSQFNLKKSYSVTRTQYLTLTRVKRIEWTAQPP